MCRQGIGKMTVEIVSTSKNESFDCLTLITCPFSFAPRSDGRCRSAKNRLLWLKTDKGATGRPFFSSEMKRGLALDLPNQASPEQSNKQRTIRSINKKRKKETSKTSQLVENDLPGRPSS